MSRLFFRTEALSEGSKARAAVFRTLHSEVMTPVFMPVGTFATVRGQPPEALQGVGFPLLLANTYHLLLRPGPEVFRRLGGIRPFMGWAGSVLTDSGGFQIFSLPNACTVTDDGAVFRSYVTGRKISLTPRHSIEMQKAIQSDIMMALDHCVPSTAERKTAEAAVRRTLLWARESLSARGDSPQALFAIVQGAKFDDLRRESADSLVQMPFDGFAIGGLAVGETKAEREDLTELSAELLPKDRPRYLMGVGTPLDLLEAVHRGVDMFDCILPTALSQRGIAFTSRGRLQLRRGVYRFSEEPIDPECACAGCARHSRAYLHHLIKTQECLGWQILAFHNLFFYRELMKRIRDSIIENRFLTFHREWRDRLQGGDPDAPVVPPKTSRRRQPSRRFGNFEVIQTARGHFSVRHQPSGEVMHSVVEPNEEAEKLYLHQSRFTDRLAKNEARPLVIWDVGLGAAVNAMAVIRASEGALPERAVRPVRIVSFEKDLDSLRLALRHPHLFPHLHHPAPSALVANSAWQSRKRALSWCLRKGDFLVELEAADKPDLIFYDPFSFKTDSALWTAKCFNQLFASVGNFATEIYTYTNSTAVRAALLAAGFFVAGGVGTGPKTETTVALTPTAHEQSSCNTLRGDWLERWERSHTRFPADITKDRYAEFEEGIRRHPQFYS